MKYNYKDKIFIFLITLLLSFGSASAQCTATISSGGPIIFCTGGSVVLNASPTGAGYSYQWKKNGAVISAATSTSYTAATSGNYTCVVTSACGSPTSNIISVTVNPFPAASITASGSTNVCPPQPVTLNANTGTGFSYQWVLGWNNIAGATTSSYSTATMGDYRCSVTANGCTSTSNVIFVNENPPMSSSIYPWYGLTTVCSGAITLELIPITPYWVTKQWYLDNGIGIGPILGAVDNGYQATQSGTYFCTVTTACGTYQAQYQGSSYISLQVGAPVSVISSAGSPTTFCSGGSVLLRAYHLAGLTFQWKLNGTNITGATSYQYAASSSGSYTCVVTNVCTSKTSNAIPVTVNPLPTATITAGGPTAICSGDSILLSATTGTGLSYQWKLNGSNVPGAVSSALYAKAAGNYTCTVSKSGCNATSNTIAVVVNNCLNMRTFFEAYYTGNRQMQPTLYLNNLSTDPTACDSITIELHAATQPYAVVSSTRCLVKTDGTSRITFPPSFINQSYYIVIRHRGSMDVWSKTPVLFNSAAMSFDFTSP